LGESLATVHRFDVPLEQATTSSLEALKAYSLGTRAADEKGPNAGLPYRQRAIALDPNFAMGYRAVGIDYNNLGQLGRASEYFTKAFQLREHASEREKLMITAHYYSSVTGELDKAAQTYQQQIESYPREAGAYLNLGIVYAGQGQYEKATEITRQAVHLAPERVAPYEGLANYTLAVQRFDETRQIIHEAQARRLDDFLMHSALYTLAFLGADSAAMAEQKQWFAGKPELEYFGTGARIRHRGVWRSCGQGTGADQAGCGLGRASGQQRRRGDLSGQCRFATSGLWQHCGSPAGSGRGSEARSRESGRRE
jgi:tetratricopeptide (TPR) repeat protein